MADYIDRNAAIDALRKLADDCPGSTEAATAAAMAISVISRLESPWISMQDRPPNKEDVALLLVRFANRIDDEWHTFYTCGLNMADRETTESAKEIEVTYWMKLPDLPEQLIGGAKNESGYERNENTQ